MRCATCARDAVHVFSFISLIAMGGVVVGVSALVVVMAVMNGLQRDLREKILIGSPDVRLLTYGDEMNMPDWQRRVLDSVKQTPNVVAAAPWVHTKGIVRKGGTWGTRRSSRASNRQARGAAEVTSIRHTRSRATSASPHLTA